MVWKPATATPLIALACAPIYTEAGVPPGVIQIVPGSGSQVGSLLADHPDVPVLSLTGSTETGRALMSRGAAHIKRVSLELGGNAPFIILPDADLTLAAHDLVRTKLFCSGQVCVTANRVFVPEASRTRFRDLVADRLRHARVGDGLAEGIDAGPLIHRHACEHAQQLLDQACAAGAQIICQNRSYTEDDTLRDGSFFAPTLLEKVEDEMPIAREEVFAPVISILSYASVDEAVQRANDTIFGLSGYVYGTDLAQCRAVASSLEVGIVGVNEWRPLKAEIPFGGVKMSGLGEEGGIEGVRDYLQTQVISILRPRLPTSA